MDHLQTEARNPASSDLDELSALEVVRLMNAEDARVIPAVGSQAEAIARGVEVIAERLRAGGRLIYLGAGTSGRLGVLDATECPPTFNAPPGMVIGLIAGGAEALTRAVEGAEDRPGLAVGDLTSISLSAADVVVGIATSGRTPYVLAGVDHARSLGAFTIGLSCNSESELIAHVDLAITPVVGPEILSGSTRLKAGTATKLVLNMLTTGAMVLLGKTHGNLMVDLRATNEKLRQRTNRIVRQLTGLDHPAADALLEACDRELKTALVSHLAGVTPAEARERLRVAQGRVRLAVGKPVRGGVGEGGEDLVLGIDGGGTGTVALLAKRESGGGYRVLGRGEGGASNRQAVGDRAAFSALDEAVSRAFAAVEVSRVEVSAACLGLAGAGRPGDQEVMRRWAAREHLARSVEVVADAELLLAAGTPAGWGVAIVAGTGSMALARDARGRTARAGGWGPVLGDEGSGYVLAVAGLRTAVRSADGRGPRTLLGEQLLAALGLAKPEELVGVVYRGGDRAALAALAPVVLRVAEEGDAVADQIVEEGVAELASSTAAAARRVDLGDVFPVALAGGLLVGSASYRQRFLGALASRGLSADPVAVVTEPAEGAVRLALGAYHSSG